MSARGGATVSGGGAGAGAPSATPPSASTRWLPTGMLGRCGAPGDRRAGTALSRATLAPVIKWVGSADPNTINLHRKECTV